MRIPGCMTLRLHGQQQPGTPAQLNSATCTQKKLLHSVIPTCVLRNTSKMGEVGHRTEAFWIGFQLIESVTYLINDLIERGKSEIRQVLFAHFFPHMFDRIELWT